VCFSRTGARALSSRLASIVILFSIGKASHPQSSPLAFFESKSIHWEARVKRALKSRADSKYFYALFWAFCLVLLVTGCNSGSSAPPPPPPDTTAPSTPTNFTSTAVSATQINLSWTASTDNVGVTGYRVERCSGVGCSNFAQIATPTTTTFNDTGLSSSTSYSYRVRATDAAGNLSTFSSTSTTTTLSSSPPVTLTLSPKRGGLTIGQKLNFTATITNDTQVTWNASGSGCSGAGCGTFSNVTATTATYTAPATAGVFNVTATSVADVNKSASTSLGVTDLAGVFTWHNDNARTGQNLQEYALTPSNVNSATFGKLFSCHVDGQTYTQPLYVANLSISGATHNVMFVATEEDSVYAFDADSSPCVTYWRKNFTNAGLGITTLPAAETGETDDLGPDIGITGTPVIDPSPSRSALYTVITTRETSGTGCSVSSPCYFRRLHALDLATGNEKFGGPIDIQASATGSGDTSDARCPVAPANTVAFCAFKEGQRPGLLLLNGTVYIAFASHGDQPPYHGWVLGYGASSLLQTTAFNATPDGSDGGIWMSGAGIAADLSGNIYVITGNGTFDTTTPRTNYGDSFIKLSTTGGLNVTDFFTPFNQDSLNSMDFDVGSGGVLVLPDSVGTAPHMIVGGDKQGNLFLLNRDTNLGKYTPGGPDATLQTLSVVPGGTSIFSGIFATPAFWQNTIYLVAVNGFPQAYTFSGGLLGTTPASTGLSKYSFPGASPAISAQGSTAGIVWAVDSSQNGSHSASLGPAVLHAYNANNLALELWNSGSSAGNAVKFQVPTIANGKVYVGTQTEVTVYGLLPN
jgi:chitodextrinase